jgi:hypothetical protein
MNREGNIILTNCSLYSFPASCTNVSFFFFLLSLSCMSYSLFLTPSLSYSHYLPLAWWKNELGELINLMIETEKVIQYLPTVSCIVSYCFPPSLPLVQTIHFSSSCSLLYELFILPPTLSLVQVIIYLSRDEKMNWVRINHELEHWS